jgi:hypothetical protein
MSIRTRTRIGMTPKQFSRVYAMSPSKVRSLILSGALGAIATQDAAGKDRFVILPEHLDQFNATHTVVPQQPKTQGDRRRALRG